MAIVGQLGDFSGRAGASIDPVFSYRRRVISDEVGGYPSYLVYFISGTEYYDC